MMEAEVVVLHPAGGSPPFRVTDRDLQAVEAVTFVEAIANLGETAVTAVLNLRQMLSDKRATVRRAAVITMTTVLDAATLPVDDETARRPSTGWVARAERLENLLDRSRDRISRRRLVPMIPPPLWTVTAVALSVVVSVCVLMGEFGLAAAVLGVRVAAAAVVGKEHDLPFESSRSRSDTGLSTITRCMAGHLTDAVVLLSSAWALMAAQRTTWGAVVMLSTVIMFIATLFRVAALQVGVQLYRLLLERVMRAGGMLVGFVCAAIFQPSVPTNTFPLLALVTAGPLVFAAGEMYRTITRIREHDIAANHNPPQVRILVTRPEHGRAISLRPGSCKKQPGEMTA
jgi:hypothetical protein